MKTLTAILGTAFVMLVSVAAVDGTRVSADGYTAPAAQHANHAADKKCCDKADGMCAREGDGKACCKDDCCKDGTCKDDCSCECCKNGSCGNGQNGGTSEHKAGCCKKAEGGNGDQKAGCCKPKGAQAKKPALMPSH